MRLIASVCVIGIIRARPEGCKKRADNRKCMNSSGNKKGETRLFHLTLSNTYYLTTGMEVSNTQTKQTKQTIFINWLDSNNS